MNHFMINEEVQQNNQLAYRQLAKEIAETGVDPYVLISHWLGEKEKLNEGLFGSIGQGLGKMARGAWNNIKQGWDQKGSGVGGQGGGAQNAYQQALQAINALMQQLPQGSQGANSCQEISQHLQQNAQTFLGGDDQGQDQGQQGQPQQQGQQGQPQQPQAGGQPPQPGQDQAPPGVDPNAWKNWSPENKQQYQARQAEIEKNKQAARLVSNAEYAGEPFMECCLKLAGIRRS